MVGIIWGHLIFQNTCRSVAPSTLALSSISSGRSRKKLMRNQMMSGTLMSTQASVTGILVFNRPILLNMVYSGMVKATGGSTRTSRTQYVMGFFRPNRNRRRAMI